jgi:hypothetical protein
MAGPNGEILPIPYRLYPVRRLPTTSGYSNDPPLQAWYLGLGVVISLVGGGWMRRVG